ncbi:N-acyl-L-homoserine lactone synthetase [Bradyrhizobium sp. USDA 3311]
MMQLIMPEYYGEFVGDLAEMHRLRYRVFKQRLDWNVEVSDMEVDELDALRPVHLLNRSSSGHIQGCVRLLPSTGPTMLRDTFPILLDGSPAASKRSDLGEQPVRARCFAGCAEGDWRAGCRHL